MIGALVWLFLWKWKLKTFTQITSQIHCDAKLMESEHIEGQREPTTNVLATKTRKRNPTKNGLLQENEEDNKDNVPGILIVNICKGY